VDGEQEEEEEVVVVGGRWWWKGEGGVAHSTHNTQTQSALKFTNPQNETTKRRGDPQFEPGSDFA